MRCVMTIMMAALTVMASITFFPLVSADPLGAYALDTANMAWIMVCIGLVLIMTPAVAMFYGGMLRKESVMSMLGQTMLVMSIVTLVWVTVGYSLAFGSDFYGVVGDLSYVLLESTPYNQSNIVAGLPDMQFMIFQCTFAIIAAALVLGAVAERARLKALLLFMVIWSIVVYAPIAHWVWGGGLFHQYLTSLDFAGGTVVHICSGATALALVLVIGARSENTQKDRPHNLPLVFIGGALLWFGWFGFNGGSALAADGIAVNAIVVTHISAATAAAVWASISWLHVGRPGALGMITGAVAGLVGITPAAGYVGPKEAIIIGAGAAVFCYLAVLMKHRMKADDALDVFAVHGVGGIWGAMATGLLAVPSIVADAGIDGDVKGLVYGGSDLFIGQSVTVVVTLVFAFSVSYALMKLISKLIPVRLSKKEEMIGQDLIEHGEGAYNL